MNALIISGSHRPESASGGVARLIAARCSELELPITGEVIDLSLIDMPFWNEGFSERKSEWGFWSEISASMVKADGFVVVCPEWGGMVPPKLKNFFLLCDTELAHKPGLIISVSHSSGGAYPVAELRMTSGKNTLINWIPEHVIVRKVEEFLQDVDCKRRETRSINRRIEYALRIFDLYVRHMKPIRQSNIMDYERYGYGM